MLTIRFATFGFLDKDFSVTCFSHIWPLSVPGVCYPTILSCELYDIQVFLVEFVLRDLYFMCMLCRSFFCPFVLVRFAIVLTALLRYADSDYHFHIVKPFLIFSVI